ncbi:MAG: hypothetical protein R2729_18580 [Bryobacteraceae bacterium]
MVVLLALPAAASAIEIATGRMLGPSHDQRAFYIRDGARAAWRKTYSGPRFKPEAAGRLMNLRIAQALFDDEWLTEFRFDPEKNTDRVIAALDAYKAHGILAVNVSLQGGFPGYNREFPAIKRGRAYKLGPGKGAHISAFRPNGELKPAWMARLLRLQRALDRRGMILNLLLFYQGQDEILAGPDAIRAAAANVADWLAANQCRNAIVDIANEFDIRGWDHDFWIRDHLGELIELVRARLRAGGNPLPISSSTGASSRLYPQIAEHADYVLIHGNNKPVEFKGARTAELVADFGAPGPIVMNEDDSGRATTPEVLRNELASCDAVFQAGGSWGYMPWRQTQMFPFRHYRPAKNSRLTPGMTLDQSDPVYFKAVLEHIRALVFHN